MALNPPPIRIPAKFEQDADLRAYFLDLHTFLRLLFVKASPDGGIEPEDGPILASQGMANAQRIEVLREAIEELAAAVVGDALPHIPMIAMPVSDSLPSVAVINQQVDQFPTIGGPVSHTEEHYHFSYTVEQADRLPPAVVTPAAHDPLPAITFVSRLQQLEYAAITANFTTRGNQFVEAQNALTVYMNPHPDKLELVIIKRYTAAGNVIIAGNGNTIDGAASNTLTANLQRRIMLYNGVQWINISL